MYRSSSLRNIVMTLAAVSISATESSDCTDIESKYGRVPVARMPNSDYFTVGNVISCTNRDHQEIYYGKDIIFNECPANNLTSDAYLYLQSVINEACIVRRRIHQLGQEWLETDIFGSPYIVRDGFQVFVECTKDGMDTAVEQSIRGDLRTILNDTSSYVQLRRDKWQFTDDTDPVRVVVVLEPVWNFIERVTSNADLSNLTLAMDQEKRKI